MTMKRLKFNILPIPCTMMVVDHFPYLERLFVCVYAMTQDRLCFRFWQVFRTDARSQSIEWPVSSACSARAEESLSPVYTDRWCSFSRIAKDRLV